MWIRRVGQASRRCAMRERGRFALKSMATIKTWRVRRRIGGARKRR
jgi:hypothetical protein